MPKLYWPAVAALAALAAVIALPLTAWWLAALDGLLVLAFAFAVPRARRPASRPDPGPPIPRLPHHPLSRREYEVARLACSGLLRNREIAEKLFIQEDTVENHLQHCYNKLGLVGGNPRLQLCAWLRDRGLDK